MLGYDNKVRNLTDENMTLKRKLTFMNYCEDRVKK